MPPIVKPDPVKEAADKIGDALKGQRDVGYFFRKEADGPLEPLGSGSDKRVVDAVKGLSPTQQGKAFDTYNGTADSSHSITGGKGRENHEEFVVKPKVSKFTLG